VHFPQPRASASPYGWSSTILNGCTKVLVFSNAVGYIQLSDIKRLDAIHSKSWFFGLLFSVILAGYKLKNLRVMEKRDGAKETKTMKALAKSGIDLVIPAQRLGWVGVSDGVVGLCGTVTSVMGIMDTYPSASKK
jgi:peroxin-11B